MKPFVIVLMSLLTVVAALFSASYLLPVQCDVVRSRVMNASPDQVYPYLNNPTEWEKWSVWNKSYDPSMIHMYGGPLTGKGARLNWSGDKIGDGQIEFTESVSPTLLRYQQTIEGDHHETQGYFSLEKVNGGTRVIWQKHTALEDNPIARIEGFLRKKKLEVELEQSLAGLDSVVTAKTGKKGAGAKRYASNRR
ncbi:SRPBCC family protein [Pontibacter ruber]|uniref:SRPBCC family protein n=1 Tax=Pontibacter ruber TaxID=1343895 RepID=A0ABW5CVC7_9BACT|nr:SRPBCC family protein [Pontibacter ruber]